MRVLQLRSIFRGLDFDGSGEIDIDELKDAVKFVANADTGSPPLIEKPEEIVQLFESMDIDKNGTVDFDEFLVGMTTSSAAGAVGSAKMANAFFDFANQHRRQTIVDQINDKKAPTDERYNALRKLYNMKYLKDEPSDATTDDIIKKNENGGGTAEKGHECCCREVQTSRVEPSKGRSYILRF